MKKIIMLGFILSTFIYGNSIENIKKEYLNTNARQTKICINNIIKSLTIERRGCCSWHGGVYGCSTGGRVICNDGSLSPSCTCAVSTPSTI